MSVSFIITILVSLSVCGLGGLVALSPAEMKSRRAFTILCFSLAAWVTANFLADVDVPNSLLWTRLTFFSVVVAVLAFIMFVNSFAAKPTKNIFLTVLVWLSALVVGALVWLPQFVPYTFFESGQDSANVATGPLYPVFVVYFLGAIVLSLGRLIVNRHNARGLRKQRMTFVLLAVGVMVAIGSITNLILPLITGVNPLSRLGTYSTLIFLGIIAYAIVRHRLFSIRFVIARSLGYLLTLVTLTTAFALVVFGVVDRLVDGALSTTQTRLLYIGIAVLAAFVYHPVKLFFDKITRRVFFRDLYVSRQVLKEISAIAVRSSLPQDLLRKSITKLDEVVAPAFIHAYVRHDQEPRLVASRGKSGEMPPHALDRLPRRTVIVLDEVLPHGHSAQSVELLQKSDVALVVRMLTAGEQVGYLLFGYKRNGSAYTDQDLSLLGTVADELAVAVQNSLRFEEIKRFNETLQQEVNEATTQLRQSNKKLRALDQAKDEFISMASHQLRTPLTSVKGYLSMALEGDAGELDTGQRRLLQEAYSSAQRMVYLITDFLNVSRLQTGKFVLETRPVNLSKLIFEEIAQLEATAASRNLDIISNLPDNFPRVPLDEDKIRQVVMNFIDNAIFYSHMGGVITVTLRRDQNEAVFTVKDQGIGVPAAERSHLFTKFYRAANAKKARPDGTGIGLFMAKKVIDTQGGSLIFESVEGKGSTFGFRVPMGS